MADHPLFRSTGHSDHQVAICLVDIRIFGVLVVDHRAVDTARDSDESALALCPSQLGVVSAATNVVITSDQTVGVRCDVHERIFTDGIVGIRPGMAARLVAVDELRSVERRQTHLVQSDPHGATSGYG
jgi:signal transduction protein with GAF and PtsI domain